MKKTLTIAFGIVITAALSAPVFAKGGGSGRVGYGGGSHSSSHGGSYPGGSGSSHKGGSYSRPTGGKTYGTHK